LPRFFRSAVALTCSLHELFDSSGPGTRYRAAHVAEGREALSSGAAWSEVSGTTQRAVTVRWVVPLTPLQAAPLENAPQPLHSVRGSLESRSSCKVQGPDTAATTAFH